MGGSGSCRDQYDSILDDQPAGFLLTPDERRTILKSLEEPNPLGIDRAETRWRDFSRVEIQRRDERIRQLEKQCEVLAAEVDRMRPVVEAAIVHLKNPNGLSIRKRDAGLWMAVTTHQASNPK